MLQEEIIKTQALLTKVFLSSYYTSLYQSYLKSLFVVNEKGHYPQTTELTVGL